MRVWRQNALRTNSEKEKADVKMEQVHCGMVAPRGTSEGWNPA